MNKYEIGQKLEVWGLRLLGGGERNSFEGELVVITHLPGWDKEYPHAYRVLFRDGVERAAAEYYLRPYPPKLPNGRGDIDEKSTREEFEKATGISYDVLKNGPNTNPDY